MLNKIPPPKLNDQQIIGLDTPITQKEIVKNFFENQIVKNFESTKPADIPSYFTIILKCVKGSVINVQAFFDMFSMNRQITSLFTHP